MAYSYLTTTSSDCGIRMKTSLAATVSQLVSEQPFISSGSVWKVRKVNEQPCIVVRVSFLHPYAAEGLQERVSF